MDLPSIIEAKAEAKRLRRHRVEQGQAISHAEALEQLARQKGFRDWNGLCAAISHRVPDSWAKGSRVTGRYLSQPFTAVVLSCEMQPPGWVSLTLDLEEAVDVVHSDGFSNHRKRIHCTVGPKGTTREKTSDGVPHVVLEV